MTQIVDDRVVLIGDVARFVDPVLFTAVSTALNSARFANLDIVAAMESGDFFRSAALDVQGDDPARHQELVRLHKRVLRAQRPLHRVPQRPALPP